VEKLGSPLPDRTSRGGGGKKKREKVLVEVLSLAWCPGAGKKGVRRCGRGGKKGKKKRRKGPPGAQTPAGLPAAGRWQSLSKGGKKEGHGSRPVASAP